MISLKDACEQVLKNNPKCYINCVNEYEKVYEFIVVGKRIRVEDYGLMLSTIAVEKETGVYLGYISICDPLYDGPYKQYPKEYIEVLLQ